MRILHRELALAIGMLAACGRKPEASQAAATDSTAESSGPQMALPGMQMMPMMRAHGDSLAAMKPEQMAAMMTAHQDLASRMVDAMGADMRAMNVPPDSAWTALSDSVRRDLADLPALSGGALTGRMLAHIERVRRMMALHERMMKM